MKRVIHFLRAGLPLCGFTNKTPDLWPAGHVWAPESDDEAAKNPSMCAVCLARRGQR